MTTGVTSWKHTVTADGSSGFKAESGRYHLYVSYACPFASRALAVRALKGLEEAISVDIVDPRLGPEGWKFTPDFPDSTPDTINGFTLLSELYKQNGADESARITVPVLFDKKEKKIVNNESADIAVMLNNEFNEFAKIPSVDLYPKELREQIESINIWVQSNINSGVYKCVNAKTQEDYERAFVELCNALDRAENILSKSRYLTGDTLTLADIRLFMTLIRFDVVYYGLFKTNKKQIVDYPNLWGFTRELYQMQEIQKIVNFDHIKTGYYHSHKFPGRGIVPLGPDIDFNEPVNRSPK